MKTEAPSLSSQSAGPCSLQVQAVIEGYLPDILPYSLVCDLRLDPKFLPRRSLWQEALEEVWQKLGLEPCATGFDADSSNPPDVLVDWCQQYLLLITEMQAQLRLPIFGKGSHRRIASDTFRLVIPSTELAIKPLVVALRAWMKVMLGLGKPELIEAQVVVLQQSLRGLKAAVPMGVNTVKFIQAADSLQVPCRRVVANLFRFGWGCRSLLLDSSMSDATSVIGCKFARHKLHAKQLLAAAGLPVAPGQVVLAAEQAWPVATKLGVPVVVKPVDTDGGKEVHVYLTTESEVRKAAEAVLSCSKGILVEKHFEAKDYRLQVLNRQVYWAVERVPGGITGDGTRKVSELLQELNRDPDRGVKGSGRPLVRISFDAEAQRLLQEQGLSPSDVPAAGRFVRLRRAANVSLGGVPVPVLEQVHPDNIDLAIRAADAFSLNIAGIDLLIGDIGTSWLESGAVICEVNAQPQMSGQLQHHVLSQLMVGQGRIPVDIVLGFPGVAALAEALQYRGVALEEGVGLVGADGVFLGSRKIENIANDSFSAALHLLANRELRRVIIAPWDSSFLRRGSPVDRFERLLIAEPNEAATTASTVLAPLLKMAQMLARLCKPEIYCYSPRNAATFKTQLRGMARRFKRLDHHAQLADTIAADVSCPEHRHD